MRTFALLLLPHLSTATAPITSSTSAEPSHCPFVAPLIQEPSLPPSLHLELLRRQNTGGCPNGYTGCSNLGQPNACCSSDTICSADAANHVACCPNGAACTGVIGSGPVPTQTGSSTGPFVFAGAATTATITTTAGNPLFPSTPLQAPTTVPNAPYPFVFIPTTFANAAVCSSYYSQCQTQFASCTASLGGGQVGGVVGGVTITNAGGAAVQVPSATGTVLSICSSLSQQACYGLPLGYCATVPGAVATGSGIIVNANQAEKSRGLGYGIGVGFALGLAGQVLG